MSLSTQHSAERNGLLNRRDLLRVGSLTIAASTLPTAVQAAYDSKNGRYAKAKSVIYLWMGGGVTHIDSFDPKPNAPEEIRGTLDDIATSLPGARFSEVMPNLAKMADQLALIRSFSHDSDDHLLSQVYTLSGRKVDRNGLFTEPNIGSMVSNLLGPRNGLPGYIAVPGITRVGATDKHASKPTTHGYTPADVAATIYKSLGIDSEGFTRDYMDRPRPILDHGTPIAEVL